jgi:hypothetical protein
LTLSPGAATGFWPSAQPLAVGILSVGMAPCGFAAGTTGALPQAGSGAAPCIRRHSKAAPPISATIRATIPEKLIQSPRSIAKADPRLRTMSQWDQQPENEPS